MYEDGRGRASMSSPALDGDVEDDASIIGRSTRDPDHFAAIFDRHAPLIHRYLARRVGGDMADDLVAETFLIAFRKRQGYDPGRADARPWLYGIATKVVSQHRRQEERTYRYRNAIAPVPDELGHADRVAAQVSAQAMGPVLGAALAKLSQKDRDVLLLVAWEDLSYEEVATALGIPVGTVRSRLNRARKKTRAVLTAEGSTSNRQEVVRNGR
ncbi:RNA polymerase sigma-70 factor, ECF subfamily [Saccharopolyspora antimicrobica]|uniref:RNA polymerase sigma-70 factor (ECF subfamily) n=2 Tax=Saccharopolyspora antimicrobica TaxID=455193 RepID=A0A1I5INF8_9PSEU|nr:RNA polymerase sigma-70 factor (ECF subfamily) [Saccharopolyspora antimicrobica]SFO62077.1 RNA polymerase sigma-70 factor, ECF subfamily [Saccharopolyspora antimicrobica]